MSALVWLTVFFTAANQFLESVPAKWAGWAWAFCPYGIYFPVERILGNVARDFTVVPAVPVHADLGERR